MSPAAARQSFPAESMELDEILSLMRERDVPKRAVDRIMQLHFSPEAISAAKAERIIEYLDALPLKDGVERPFL
jgi:hypothetical protein